MLEFDARPLRTATCALRTATDHTFSPLEASSRGLGKIAVVVVPGFELAAPHHPLSRHRALVLGDDGGLAVADVAVVVNNYPILCPVQPVGPAGSPSRSTVAAAWR